jgi:hypothetical protein
LATRAVGRGGLLWSFSGLGGLKGAQIGSLMAFGKQMQAMGPPPEAVGFDGGAE